VLAHKSFLIFFFQKHLTDSRLKQWAPRFHSRMLQ
jgi:hypothetical protein